MAKKKNTLMGNMPSKEVLAEGRQIVAEFMEYLADNKLFLIFDPDDYKLRLGPDGLTYAEDGVQPKGKIPYTKEEDEAWDDNYSLGVEWGEFDPDNFDDDVEED